MQIRLGDHDVGAFDETDNQVVSGLHFKIAVFFVKGQKTQVRRVEKVVTYWRFQNRASAPGDLSLLLLDAPLDFSER